jgi:murein DD-endopeptidase MepM/ murein hydrolase activator NlpD
MGALTSQARTEQLTQLAVMAAATAAMGPAGTIAAGAAMGAMNGGGVRGAIRGGAMAAATGAAGGLGAGLASSVGGQAMAQAVARSAAAGAVGGALGGGGARGALRGGISGAVGGAAGQAFSGQPYLSAAASGASSSATRAALAGQGLGGAARAGLGGAVSGLASQAARDAFDAGAASLRESDDGETDRRERDDGETDRRERAAGELKKTDTPQPEKLGTFEAAFVAGFGASAEIGARRAAAERQRTEPRAKPKTLLDEVERSAVEGALEGGARWAGERLGGAIRDDIEAEKRAAAERSSESTATAERAAAPPVARPKLYERDEQGRLLGDGYFRALHVPLPKVEANDGPPVSLLDERISAGDRPDGAYLARRAGESRQARSSALADRLRMVAGTAEPHSLFDEPSWLSTNLLSPSYMRRERAEAWAHYDEEVAWQEAQRQANEAYAAEQARQAALAAHARAAQAAIAGREPDGAAAERAPERATERATDDARAPTGQQPSTRRGPARFAVPSAEERGLRVQAAAAESGDDAPAPKSDKAGTGQFDIPSELAPGRVVDTDNANIKLQLKQKTVAGKAETTVFALHRGTEGWSEAELDDFISPLYASTLRGKDPHGEGHYGARRVRPGGDVEPHHGTDLVANPGAAVFAPVSGEVRIYLNYADKKDLTAIAIIDEKTKKTYVLGYVTPHMTYTDELGNVYKGTFITNDTKEVVAGQQVGVVQDITKAYPKITNHLHFEVAKDVDNKTINGQNVKQRNKYDTGPLLDRAKERRR